MSVEVKSFSDEVRYSIFEALSHQTRVEILKLVQEKQTTFSTLKRNLGIESSGQLQHHLQKLSGFVDVETKSGSYILTDLGRQALDIYASSQFSGQPLEAACCLPTRTETPQAWQVTRAGTRLRLSVAGILLALTIAYLALGRPMFVSGASATVGFGFSGAIIASFFGVSFLIAGMTRSPGCEVTAIPNLFAKGRKYYCGCVMAPFNLPDGRFLERVKKPSSDLI